MIKFGSLLASILLLASCASAPGAAPAITAPSTLLTGERLDVRISGLRPGEVVSLVSSRQMEKWEQGADGGWRSRQVAMYAWANFRADRRGAVNADDQPIDATWSNADARGLLWAGYPVGSPELNGHVPESVPLATGDTVAISLLRDGALLDTHTMTLRNFIEGVRTQVVSQPGLDGVLALPPAPGRYPVVILLHGSEGGGRDEATSQAQRFASRGFAAFAVNYFAWPHNAIPGVPENHVNTPIEMIAAARDWLATQPEVDVERLALYGVSKGAEFTASAAARYAWIDAAIPCVGSDLVWEGYGRPAAPGEQLSSWSWGGQPLPFVPLPSPDIQRWPVNTMRYEEALAQLSAEQVEAARIPVERASANFLLIGGDRDEVWASGRMSRNLEQVLRARRNGATVETALYPMAGHQICGDGAYPIRLYSIQSDRPDSKSLDAEGIATVDAWERTVRFLHQQLDVN